jgi:hypothetical protein
MSREYDSMKHFLNITRKMKNGLNEAIESQNPMSGDQSSNSERVAFNDVKATGFLKNSTGSKMSDEYRNQVIEGVGAFLKASGLIMDVVNVEVMNGRIIITSATIKNPGVDFIKDIVIDTKLESPKLELIPGNVEINPDYMTLIGTLIKTYNDPQVGRNNLVQISQTNI